ncbi:hypothetical protein DW222_00035 [Blautia obeum]|uniref:Uncharacterized protein n=1 Tax=Blautia obeum TaxID=40520 RepID=A0A414W4V5_9FIRM|nr:hypothetical protein DW222_00035 [Blautia obeum]
MNRCDFSSISTCLKNHISESNQMSQPDFLYELFEDFMDDPTNQDLWRDFLNFPYFTGFSAHYIVK